MAWRLEQLQRLEMLLERHGEAVLSALAADLGKPALEASFELVAIRQELRLTRRRRGTVPWSSPCGQARPFSRPSPWAVC